MDPPNSLPTPEENEAEHRKPESTKQDTIPDQTDGVGFHSFSTYSSEVVQTVGTTLSHSPPEKPDANAGDSVDPLLVHESQQPEALMPQGL